MKRIARGLAVLLAAMVLGIMQGATQARAAEKELTVGYQPVYNPWKVAIAAGAFEKETGYRITWRKFDSGAGVINAIASGDVQIAMAGSSPIAAAVSRGLDMQLFWILEDIAAAEALVVRDGSGIIAPQDMRGKKVAVPFVSTTHFHLLFALERFGIDPKDIDLRNMQPPEIAAAWERGEIDAAFIWNPTLGQIKKTGKVLITSGLLSSWGKATFDGMVVDSAWGAAHAGFMARFVKVIADADAAYRDNKAAWTADSPEAKAIAEMAGGNAADVPEVLALYNFPTLKEQLSCAWLGCGKDGGGARALKFTSEFLMAERKINALQPDYGKFVNPAYAEAAAEM